MYGNWQSIPGLDMYWLCVPAGPHAFLRLSGQFGPPQFIFHWPKGPVFFFLVLRMPQLFLLGICKTRKATLIRTYFSLYTYRPNVREIINSRRENIWVITCFWGASGFFGGPVDFLIHWPPGPVVATVQHLSRPAYSVLPSLLESSLGHRSALLNAIRSRVTNTICYYWFGDQTNKYLGLLCTYSILSISVQSFCSPRFKGYCWYITLCSDHFIVVINKYL